MAAAAQTWRPILTGAAGDQALEVVRDIARDLRARFAAGVPDAEAYSLADGRAGAALFHAYLGEAAGDGGACEAAVGLLEHALEAATERPGSAWLFQGLTGVAWALAHLTGRLLEVGDEDPNDSIDQALLELLSAVPWPGHFDLISGLVGIGVYTLERLPRPPARACLEAVVARLAELAERREEGVIWWTAPALLPGWERARYPRGYGNLGVAHGLPGVVGLLGKACAAGVAAATAGRLLEGAVAWLLAQRLPPGSGTCFPSRVAPGEAPRPARSAWCYGDPGVASTLLLAARSVGRPAWEAEAIAVARRAALRPAEESGVVDAGLCHGAAGLAHIFHRFYQATGEPAFEDATRRWLGRALAYRRPGAPVGGFATARPGADGEHVLTPEAGFLEGAAGVGLVLLAAATPIEPAWDRILLLS